MLVLLRRAPGAAQNVLELWLGVACDPKSRSPSLDSNIMVRYSMVYISIIEVYTPQFWALIS